LGFELLYPEGLLLGLSIGQARLVSENFCVMVARMALASVVNVSF
jgi:hypothetical protein